MSWSVQFKARIEAIEAAAYDATPAFTVGYGEDEQKAAFRMAVEAAVVAASAVGPPSAEVQVTASGHANPNNEPEGGWAKDEIRLVITRV